MWHSVTIVLTVTLRNQYAKRNNENWILKRLIIFVYFDKLQDPDEYFTIANVFWVMRIIIQNCLY